MKRERERERERERAREVKEVTNKRNDKKLQYNLDKWVSKNYHKHFKIQDSRNIKRHVSDFSSWDDNQVTLIGNPRGSGTQRSEQRRKSNAGKMMTNPQQEIEKERERKIKASVEKWKCNSEKFIRSISIS